MGVHKTMQEREREAQQGKVRRAEESGKLARSQDLWARWLHAPLPAPAERHNRGWAAARMTRLGVSRAHCCLEACPEDPSFTRSQG